MKPVSLATLAMLAYTCTLALAIPAPQFPGTDLGVGEDYQTGDDDLTVARPPVARQFPGTDLGVGEDYQTGDELDPVSDA